MSPDNPLFKTDDAWIDEVHHAWMKHQPEHVPVGQPYLVQEPGDVDDEPKGHLRIAGHVRVGKHHVAGEKGDDEAGNDPQGNVKGVEFARQYEPGRQADEKGEEERGPEMVTEAGFLRGRFLRGGRGDDRYFELIDSFVCFQAMNFQSISFLAVCFRAARPCGIGLPYSL
jgi:hypothetical protein